MKLQMNIQEIRQNFPEDTMRIEIKLSNYCNYKCWYCWPGSNEGTYKFPNYDTLVANLTHLLDYYLKYTNKKKFDFNLLGGEATHWPRFIDFISHFKKNYDCVFSLVTNGSKSLEWWSKAIPYLDYISISSHREFSDKEHLRNVADFIYSQNTIVVMLQLMDPNAWDKCMETIEYYKKSKHKWSIRYVEVIDMYNAPLYTKEQQQIISKVRARRANLFYFLRNNKSYRSRVTVLDDKGKKYKIPDNAILLNRLNKFRGWECNVGVDWLTVDFNGTMAGICSNRILGNESYYNLYDADFIEKFNPKIVPAICEQENCWCSFEINMPKRKLETLPSNKKVIPIYAN